MFSRNEFEILKDTTGNDKDRLNTKVEVLTETINAKFKELMRKMGYAGEVVLVKDDDDFKDYGLHIRIKFDSSGVELQRLSASVHSGGEKSVTTAIYMMALQELTREEAERELAMIGYTQYGLYTGWGSKSETSV